ncbi:MAG: hypothetical protein E7497_00790 [Ruminococcus sp.]|nr:hypothetical protein [Ruminococcus sp.]
MKRKILSMIAAAVMMTVFACSEKKESDVHRIISGNTYENGMIYNAGTWPNETKRFLDFTSLETAPLCAVPNCTHSSSSSECLTRVVNDNCMLVDDYLYYFVTNGQGGLGEMVATPDGYEHRMESKLMRVSLDSSETETVCTFTDSLVRSEDKFLLIDNMLYFITFDPDPKYTENGGYEGFGSNGGYDFLCSIKINTGEYTNYGYFCYVEDEYPAADHSGTASMIGYYEGNIILEYSFLKELPEVDENGIPLNEEGYMESWAYYTYEFNPKTKEFTRNAELDHWRFGDDCRVLYDDDSPVATVVKGDETYTIHGMWSCEVINNKVFGDQNKWCNLGEETVYALTEEYKGYSVVAFHDEKYILFNNRKAVKLSEEELIANSTIYEGEN